MALQMTVLPVQFRLLHLLDSPCRTVLEVSSGPGGFWAAGGKNESEAGPASMETARKYY